MDMGIFERFRTKKPEEKMYGPEPEPAEHKKERLEKVLEDMAITYSEMDANNQVSKTDQPHYQYLKKKIDEFESNEHLQQELIEYTWDYYNEDESLRWRVNYILNKLREVKAKKIQTP